MNPSNKPAPVTGKALGNQLLEDLALLCDGPSVDLQIAFDGGLIAMRSNDTLIFQESAETRWMRVDGPARVQMLSTWIHDAACKYRQLQAGGRGVSKVVA